MYQFSPISDRVAARRKRYREDMPVINLDRYKLITTFYKEHPELSGELLRAYNFKYMCENLPLYMDDDELLVGTFTSAYHASAIYPENAIDWIIPTLKDGVSTREFDPYRISDEDRDYVLNTVDFWLDRCMTRKLDPYIPEEYQRLAANGCYTAGPQKQAMNPVGHFCPNNAKAVKEGYGPTLKQARERCAQMLEDGIEGDDAAKYDFYRAVVICCEAAITFGKRYGEFVSQKAAECTDPVRKAELEKVARNAGTVMESGATDFWSALQALWMNQTLVMLDSNLHGTSMGRIDQYVGPYLKHDLETGAITREFAQELCDTYYLRTAEMCKCHHVRMEMAGPGYTSGTLMTLGGTDRQGNDATNEATYMFLEAAARLVLHDPPTALRCHPGMPDKLWDCAIECTKRAGGVPSFYSDPVQIKALTQNGRHSLEDARNYCLIGCVEPSGCGDDWACSGANGTENYTNMVNGLLLAINDGNNPMPNPDGSKRPQTGPHTGYLYEMTSIEQVMEAFKTQIQYWVKWNVTMVNIFEERAAEFLPQPFVSSLMEGCMESGKDVMRGGAKYNGCGLTAVGLGNVADSLNIIDQVCFKTKKYTTRELYDAVMANWEGYEEMRGYINEQVPRYGNGDPEADKFVEWIGNLWADTVTSKTGARCHYKAGTWPVTMNVVFGKFTAATPDGRHAGEPLADGISAVQQMDTHGPAAELRSVSLLPQSRMENGTLLNMKFHPTALAADSGKGKLVDLMKTYFFEMGGGQMQLNVVSADTMRDAQKHPENYQDLVVRIAGFSAYFVDVYKQAQDDLIRRTEQAL